MTRSLAVVRIQLQICKHLIVLRLSFHITSIHSFQQHSLLYSSFSPLFCPVPCSFFFFPFKNLGVCTQFLLCESFSWMDERPQPIHHRAYPPPSSLFLYHLAVNLTSDVPVLSLSYPFSLSFSYAVSTSLSPSSPILRPHCHDG